jgi:small subunit ribosomal protein S11
MAEKKVDVEEKAVEAVEAATEVVAEKKPAPKKEKKVEEKPAPKAEKKEEPKAEKETVEKKAEEKAAPKAKKETGEKTDEKAEPKAKKEKAEKKEEPNVEKKAKEDNKPKLATAAELLADSKIEPIKRRKGSKNVPVGIAFVKTTFNNTIVSITDMRGNVISWSSAGRCNFKGSRKSTAFAATTVAQEAARGAIGHGMTEVEVRVQGPGAGRESAVRAIQSAGLVISAIKDTTAIPHNGCRPPKRRRV